MSGVADATKSPPSTSGPESPTTARPLEMDDDDIQDAAILGDDGGPKPSAGTTAPTSVAETAEVAPPKPPRPMSDLEKNELTLKEAFPSIEPPVIKAVLRASNGRVDRAFNALLEMTDPEAVQRDDQPPPQPPRPVTAPVGQTATPQSQLEADELYARQLAQRYENDGAYEQRTANHGGGHMPRGRQQTGLTPNQGYDDREHSFIDDDLPAITENLRKGFVETQTKVNSWFTNLKKRIDDGFDELDNRTGTAREDSATGSSFMGRPTRDPTRRSPDYDRYDADPELLSDDFAGMKFNSDGTPAKNPRAANPNLFKPPPPSKSPRPGSEGRKVAFNNDVEDIDAYDASPRIPPKDLSGTGSSPGAGAKASKWQPLSTIEPSPIAENDPFSLGDSDDEKDAKSADKKETEIKTDDSDAERLRRAAAEAMADSLVEDDKPKIVAGDKKI